jgi:hypothetical protein
MPVEGNEYVTVVTGPAIAGLRALAAAQDMETRVKFAGKLRLTRLTNGQLVEVASEYTGKKYSRTAKGMTQAAADLRALLDGKTLDEVGETREVNQLVGGIAADL